jgi:hypothetical protein
MINTNDCKFYFDVRVEAIILPGLLLWCKKINDAYLKGRITYSRDTESRQYVHDLATGDEARIPRFILTVIIDVCVVWRV